MPGLSKLSGVGFYGVEGNAVLEAWRDALKEFPDDHTAATERYRELLEERGLRTVKTEPRTHARMAARMADNATATEAR